MGTKLQPVRGTHDCLPEQSEQRQMILAVTRAICERYGYGEIATPIFEFTEVFARTLGDHSDIVSKEMYSFEDRGGESLTLRPEFTAGIARALISGGLNQHLPLKLYSFGPAFRYERPQKGRMRQFHQFDVECLGIAHPLVDVEMIAMAQRILEALGIAETITLELNSLGDAESRAAYREQLVAYFSAHKAQLSEESRLRLEKNPLRILDSKDEGDKALVANAPEMMESFNEASRDFFQTVCEGLKALGIAYTWNKHLVRGMDYYSHTVFEFTSNALGAQNAVLSGGRYDKLVQTMGGPDTPAVGWAFGMERIESLVTMTPSPQPSVAVIPVSNVEMPEALKVAQRLRDHEVVVQFDYSGNMKKRLNRADKSGAVLAVIVGGDELAKGVVTLRGMQDGTQQEVAMEALPKTVKEHIA